VPACIISPRLSEARDPRLHGQSGDSFRQEPSRFASAPPTFHAFAPAYLERARRAPAQRASRRAFAQLGTPATSATTLVSKPRSRQLAIRATAKCTLACPRAPSRGPRSSALCSLKPAHGEARSRELQLEASGNSLHSLSSRANSRDGGAHVGESSRTARLPRRDRGVRKSFHGKLVAFARVFRARARAAHARTGSGGRAPAPVLSAPATPAASFAS
jgi:hypothetical protein